MSAAPRAEARWSSARDYWGIFRLAFPIILANASVPLLGLADTAAIGRTGGAAHLGAIALGGVVFSFVYWGFGFLRMGTSGLTAQAAGAQNWLEVRAVLYRAVALGAGLGLLLVLGQGLISRVSLALLDASPEVEAHLVEYFYIRIWGAPATLGLFALMGSLIGLGNTSRLLLLQLGLNGLNIALNVLLVLGLGWGVRGIALGTLLAEWLSLGLGVFLVFGSLSKHPVAPFNWRAIFIKEKIVETLKLNSDIMLRTLALLAGFAWFANQGARFGDETLAANHLLLQFISLSAFFLDGYAFAVESLVGRALGGNNRLEFLRVVRQSSWLSGLSALGLALLVWFAGEAALSWLTQDLTVRAIARVYLPWAALYVLLSFVAFQLDGVFIGATRGREMRNATLMALLVFLGLGWLLVPSLGQMGLWIAFVAYVVARGLGLLYYFPRVLSGLGAPHQVAERLRR